MTRRVVEHTAVTVDRDPLVVVTVYETGINKEKVRELNKFSKRHGVLVRNGENYEWK